MTLITTQTTRPSSVPRLTLALTRLGNLIVDPVAAFRDVAECPTAGLAFVSLIALRFGSLFLFYQPDVELARLVTGLVFQIVTVWPLTFVLTLLLWTSTLMCGVRAAWSALYCTVVHVVFAHTLLTVAIASVAGALLPASVDVDLRHPPFTNLGSLVGSDGQSVAHALFAEIDVRSAYALLLVWLGVRASVADRSGRRAAQVVGACTSVYLLLVTLSALMRS
jgi:hypothetical protein